MDYSYLLNTILLSLIFFILWSGLLYSQTIIVDKFFPQISRWSIFWCSWLVLAVVPLLAFYIKRTENLIPELLKNKAIIDNGQYLHTDIAKSVTPYNQISDFQGLLLILIVMVVTYCGYSLFRYFLALQQIHKVIRQSSLLQHSGREIAFTYNQQQLIERLNVKVYVTRQSISPFVFGLFRRALILPEYVFTLPKIQRTLLIEHELIHIKRYDPQMVLFFSFCSALFCFNPFIRYYEKRFIQAMELNCDAEVINTFPNDKLDYAHTLIASLKCANKNKNSDLLTSFTGTQLSKSDFEQRIRASMSAIDKGLIGVKSKLFMLFTFLILASFSVLANRLLPTQVFAINNVGINPVTNFTISSGFGVVNQYRGARPHQAIDLAAAKGTEVIASYSGTVLIADDSSLHENYGKVVLIEHGGQMQTLYAHLDQLSVKAGQYIVAGQQLGTVGTTGRVTGPHLHFEMLNSGRSVDPSLYLDL